MKSLIVVATMLVFVVSGFAQTESQEPGYQEHDGFFLSLSGGPSYSNTKDKLQGFEITFSGVGFGLDVRIGGTVAENLILSGDITGWSITNPKTEVSGVGSATTEGSLFFSMYGAGLTYYFMPTNIFVSGSVGLGIYSVEKNGTTGRTDPGIGVYVKAGKEWWTSAQWGLGFAVTFGYSSVKNTGKILNVDVTEELSGYSIGLQFNATLN